MRDRRPLPLHGVPALDAVASDLFTLRKYAQCMGCTFCNDSCCQYGCDVNLGERDKLLAVAAELKPFVAAAPEAWFDSQVFEDPEYPTGRFVRARVHGTGCVFLSPSGRGCSIHQFALATGRDYHDIKPSVCWLFPVCWDQRVLRPSSDARDDLVCKGTGPTLYENSRDELRHVFGDGLIAQLDRYAAEAKAATYRPDGAGGAVAGVGVGTGVLADGAVGPGTHRAQGAHVTP